MVNIGGLKRDFLLLGSLIFMVKVATNHKKPEVVAPVLYAPAKQSATSMTRSIPMGEQTPQPIAPLAMDAPEPEQQPTDASFVVHEANSNIIEHIETAQHQINQLLALVKPATKQAAQLKSMQQRLTQLKKEYKNTSPAIALLGPIGTAGIVLKENALEKNLLRMVNMTRSILHTIARIDEEHSSYTSIAQGLEKNAALLASLSKENTQA